MELLTFLKNFNHKKHEQCRALIFVYSMSSDIVIEAIKSLLDSKINYDSLKSAYGYLSILHKKGTYTNYSEKIFLNKFGGKISESSNEVNKSITESDKKAKQRNNLNEKSSPVYSNPVITNQDKESCIPGLSNEQFINNQLKSPPISSIKNSNKSKTTHSLPQSTTYDQNEDENTVESSSSSNSRKKLKLANDGYFDIYQYIPKSSYLEIFYSHIYVPKKSLSGQDRDLYVKPDYLFLPLQCNICGLRYFVQENLDVHIEDHKRRSQLQKYGTSSLQPTHQPRCSIAMRREFFNIYNEQSKDGGVSVKSSTVNLVFPLLVYHKILWSYDQPNCNICSKIIDKVWDDQTNAWILSSAVKLDEKLDIFAHIECIE